MPLTTSDFRDFFNRLLEGCCATGAPHLAFGALLLGSNTEGVIGLEVVVQDNESLDRALRRFKRKVQQEDIIKDIKKHAYYLKPADKRRAKQALARKRSRKKQRRETEWRRRAAGPRGPRRPWGRTGCGAPPGAPQRGTPGPAQGLRAPHR